MELTQAALTNRQKHLQCKWQSTVSFSTCSECWYQGFKYQSMGL